MIRINRILEHTQNQENYEECKDIIETFFESHNELKLSDYKKTYSDDRESVKIYFKVNSSLLNGGIKSIKEYDNYLNLMTSTRVLFKRLSMLCDNISINPEYGYIDCNLRFQNDDLDSKILFKKHLIIDGLMEINRTSSLGKNKRPTLIKIKNYNGEIVRDLRALNLGVDEFTYSINLIKSENKNEVIFDFLPIKFPNIDGTRFTATNKIKDSYIPVIGEHVIKSIKFQLDSYTHRGITLSGLEYHLKNSKIYITIS